MCNGVFAQALQSFASFSEAVFPCQNLVPSLDFVEAVVGLPPTVLSFYAQSRFFAWGEYSQ